jgi:hypothetical protein
MKAFLQEELFLRLLRSPYGLLQPNRPQSNVNAKRSAERFESTGKILADGFKFSINADTVDFTETHDHLNRGISAQTVTGNFRTVFLITDVTHVYEKKRGPRKARKTRKNGIQGNQENISQAYPVTGCPFIVIHTSVYLV